MQQTIDTLNNLVDRGIFVPSSDFSVERLPDGREKLHLLKKVKAAGCAPSITITFSGILFDCGCITGTHENIDVGGFNTSYVLTKLDFSPGCLYRYWTVLSSGPIDQNTVCGGGSTVYHPDLLIDAYLFGGIWKIVAVAGSAISSFTDYIFIGNPSTSPVANAIVSCATDTSGILGYLTPDNAPSTFPAGAHGGIATISIP